MAFDIVIGGDAQPASFDIVIGTTTPPPPATPPGPTIDALNAGPINRRWVVGIEGHPNLLTDAPAAAAVTAWDGSDWTAALHGLYVNLDEQLDLNPWDPFPTGGRLTLRVAPDRDDTFGVATHRKTGAGESQVTESVDCDDTVIKVKSTVGFNALGGVAYVGTEAIAYANTLSLPPRLGGLTRGKYSPFLTDDGDNFAHPHTVDDDPLGFQIPPVARSQPRQWIGKWTGLWMHRYSEATGLLNLKEDARLVFAGRINAKRDNPAMTTDLEVEHVLSVVKRAVLGNNMWSAKMKEGIALREGDRFDFKESVDAGATRTTPDPLIVTTGASGAYELEPGIYTIHELLDAFSKWLAKGRSDGDIAGTYNFALSADPNAPNGGSRVRVSYRIPGVGPIVWWWMWLPKEVNRFLGELGHIHDNYLNLGERIRAQVSGDDDTDEEHFSSNVPLRCLFSPLNSLELVDERGEFFDQSAKLPPWMAQALTSAGDKGVVIVDGVHTAGVVKSGASFVQVAPWQNFGSPDAVLSAYGANGGLIEISFDDLRGPITVQQYLHWADTLANFLKLIFYSTGTAGFNHATYDAMPAPFALAIPGALLGDDFEASCDALPGADVETPFIITKPTRLVDLLGGDLKLRFAYLRWKDEHLQFSTWTTPVDSAIILDEANKASPAGTKDEERPTSVEDVDWTRNVVKLEYERNFTLSDSAGAYRKVVVVANRTAIEDSGRDARVETIRAQNTYSEYFLGAGGGVEALIPKFKATAELFTAPINRVTRTIDSRYWQRVAAGDVVLFTDGFARDPDTGLRGVALRPATIVSHRWNPGGLEPGSKHPRSMNGQVTLLLRDVVRVVPYVPTADIDDTAADAGYTEPGGVPTITCYPHRYSESGEPVDASYMTAGRKIRIVERDPPNPAAPLQWNDVTVVSQTGNDIVIDTTLVGFDGNKIYRVFWDNWINTIANQQLHAYQADAADGLVADDRPPFEYLAGYGSLTFWPPPTGAVNDPSDPAELPPDSAHGDGVALDVGTELALHRLANQLLDYKTAKSNPILLQSPGMEVSGDVTHDWILCMMIPVNLTADGLPNGIERKLYVAPQFKSSDGGTVHCRISLRRHRVTQATTSNVSLGVLYAHATFTTTSTTYTTPTAEGLGLSMLKNELGNCWLHVELNVPVASGSTVVSCLGLAVCKEGPRE